MDTSNLTDLRRMAPPDARDRVRLLLDFDPSSDRTDVPDPYYGGERGFDDVLAMIDRACDGLLDHVRTEIVA
jgi:protein-tyrosine phosphatase